MEAVATWIVGLLGGIVGIVLTVALRIILNEPLQQIVARTWFGRYALVRSIGVRGIWYCEHKYKSGSREKTESQIIVLNQFGSAVYGLAIAGGEHKHRIKGSVRQQQYFTGTWENIHPDKNYHGAFQLFIRLRGNDMNGKWVGFDGSNNIQWGPWKWERFTSETSEKAQNRVIDEISERERDFPEDQNSV